MEQRMRHKIMSVCVVLAVALAACTSDEPSAESSADSECGVVYPELHISVSDMSLSMEPVSRALEPMTTDLEKYVRTIAVFEFDNEGLHEKSSTTYHFIDFQKGTVDGMKNVGEVVETEYGVVDTKLDGIPFNSYSSGTICLVANVTEEQVQDFYDTYREPGQSNGRMTFDKFKEWSLPFEYKKRDEWKYEEEVSGHVNNMYMFGYYQGEITNYPNSKVLRVDLGRLASRLDITIINKTGQDIKERLGYHFDNVCRSAYFFPIKMSMPPVIGAGLSRTVICAGEGTPVEGAEKPVPATFPVDSIHTRYFYVAAHSAADLTQATKLHLFWNCKVLDDDFVPEGGKDFQVPLCNIHPSEAGNVENGYSLSRNTRYHFTIRLTKKSDEATRSRSDVDYEYGRQGEIIVYVP